MKDARLLVLGALAGLCVILSAQCGARAAACPRRPLPEAQWGERSRNVLASVLDVEGGNRVDRVAIPFVLARRWRMQRQGWDFPEQCLRYSTPFRDGRAHVRAATEAERVELDRWAAGLVADPCSNAIHWASPSIVSRRHQLCPGAANVFVGAMR